MQPQPSGLTHEQRLQVIEEHDQGHSFAQLSQNYDVAESTIKNVLNRRERQEPVQVKSTIRKHISLGNQLTVIHLLDSGVKTSEIRRRFSLDLKWN